MTEPPINLNRFTFDIPELAEVLRKRKEGKQRTTLLIGAGCSVDGGVPLAGQLVKIIAKVYPHSYRRAMSHNASDESEYARCMDALSPDERQGLFEKHIDTAQVNLAHVCMAALMKHGYAHRVLSVNFDNLLIRACAMEHFFPAIYDLAVAPATVNYANLTRPAIFYLHGQITSYKTKNTSQETEGQANLLHPCFNFENDHDLWIVVGYSGANDAIFKRYIGSANQFHSGMYWTCHDASGPAENVQQALFTRNKYAYLQKNIGADAFFQQLAIALEIFPPPFLGRPFTYLNTVLDQLKEWPLPKDSNTPHTIAQSPEDVHEVIQAEDGGNPHVIAQTRKVVQEAIQAFETEEPTQPQPQPLRWASVLEANFALMAGDNNRVVNLWHEADNASQFLMQGVAAYAYIGQGDALYAMANQATGEEAQRLFQEATEKYQQALVIKPDFHEALNKWGNVLYAMAKQATGEEAQRLFQEATEKYQQALVIKPDFYEALNNWGGALLLMAKQATGEEAQRLFQEATEKYQQALVIKPDFYEALGNWGSAISDMANQATGEEARHLREQAIAKYQQALAVKPDDDQSLYNWGSTLAQMAHQATGLEARHLWEQVIAKNQEALVIKPDFHEALGNMGAALLAISTKVTGEEAQRFREQGIAKIQEALAIKPDFYTAIGNWARTLSDMAKQATGEEARHLFKLANEKFQENLVIKPDDYDALNNWSATLLYMASQEQDAQRELLLKKAEEKALQAAALQPGVGTYNIACVMAFRGNADACRSWLEAALKYNKLPARAHLEQDTDMDSMRGQPWFTEILERAPQ